MFFNFLPTKGARENFLKLLPKESDVAFSFSLGKSILGSDINCIRLGTGERSIISVGAHHGMEYLTATALYNVILDMLDNLTRTRVSYGVNLEFLLQKFTFWFVPCLNPDGVDMVLSGAESSPLFERVLKMNGGADFSEWQANARGVDLNHNYDFRFFEYKRLEEKEGIMPGKTRYSGEYPESEPESRALANLVRFLSPVLLLSFHTQGEEVFFRPRNQRGRDLAKRCAALLGYSVSAPTGLADYGGLSDYCGERLGIPSLTIELGRGRNPLPTSQLPAISERLCKLHVLIAKAL